MTGKNSFGDCGRESYTVYSMNRHMCYLFAITSERYDDRPNSAGKSSNQLARSIKAFRFRDHFGKNFQPAKSIVEYSFDLANSGLHENAVGVVAIIDPQERKMSVCSFGHTRFLVIRKGAIFSGCQLKKTTNCFFDRSNGISTFALDAEESEVALELDDVIILGSDGLFNSISDQVILGIVNTNSRNGASSISDLLMCEAARECASKPDDITVIVHIFTEDYGSQFASHSFHKGVVDSFFPVGSLTRVRQLEQHLNPTPLDFPVVDD
jgi:serine/threonine protein phosphatase PrpC